MKNSPCSNSILVWTLFIIKELPILPQKASPTNFFPIIPINEEIIYPYSEGDAKKVLFIIIIIVDFLVPRE